MMKNKILIIAAVISFLLFFAISVALFWYSGIDFNHRGFNQAMAIFFSILSATALTVPVCGLMDCCMGDE